MTLPTAPQRDAATPALPRATQTLVAQLGDGWTHTITHAHGPATFGGLSQDTDGEGKRHRIEISEDVDSVCLRAHHGGDGRAFVAVWWRRPGAKSWKLEDAFRRPAGDELALKRVTATELTAYVTQPPPPDPAIAEQLARDLAELAEHRARWEANLDVWVPTETPWRDVRVGDVVIGRDGRLWTIAERFVHPMRVDGRIGTALGIRATCGDQMHSTPSVVPDATTQVLMPVPLRDALTLLRSELGSRIIETERKTA